MDDELVTYEMDGPVALIGLNRPAKRNALNLALMADLEAAAARAAPKARAAVIFGHGDHFSAGLDLAELFQRIKDGAPRDPAPAFASIAAGAIPFVAALHGAVIGGGLEIAAACQLRVADATAFFALPEGQRGIFVGGGGSVRIPRLIGVARMQDMMLTGRTVAAAEAERWGMIQYLTEAGGALAQAKALAAKIAANSPAANQAITQGLARIADLPQDQGLFLEGLVGDAVLARGSDEGLRAFLDKTARPIARPGK